MACNEKYEALLVDYLDGALEGEGKVALEKHLAACPSCAADLKGMPETLDLLRDLPALEPPPAMLAEILSATTGKVTFLRRAWKRVTEIPLSATAAALVACTLLVVILTVPNVTLKQQANSPSVVEIPIPRPVAHPVGDLGGDTAVALMESADKNAKAQPDAVFSTDLKKGEETLKKEHAAGEKVIDNLAKIDEKPAQPAVVSVAGDTAGAGTGRNAGGGTGSGGYGVATGGGSGVGSGGGGFGRGAVMSGAIKKKDAAKAQDAPKEEGRADTYAMDDRQRQAAPSRETGAMSKAMPAPPPPAPEPASRMAYRIEPDVRPGKGAMLEATPIATGSAGYGAGGVLGGVEQKGPMLMDESAADLEKDKKEERARAVKLPILERRQGAAKTFEFTFAGLITDEKQLGMLWRDLYVNDEGDDKPAAPSVDFIESFVVAILPGAHYAGGAVKIKSVVWDGERLVVAVHATHAEKRASDLREMPYCIAIVEMPEDVRIKRSTPIDFVYE